MKEKHVQRRRVSQFVFTGSLRAAVARPPAIEHHILDQAQEGGGALRQRPQNPAK